MQRAKVTLSHATRTVFRFTDGDLELEEEVRRDQFEDWISEELAAIEGAVGSLLNGKTGAAATDVDMVFLTGGCVPPCRSAAYL